MYRPLGLFRPPDHKSTFSLVSKHNVSRFCQNVLTPPMEQLIVHLLRFDLLTSNTLGPKSLNIMFVISVKNFDLAEQVIVH